VWVGEQYLSDHADYLRVVLVPTSDQYGPRDAVTYSGERLNPRALMTRDTVCDAYLWAGCASPETEADPVDADYRIMDALINCVLACIHGIALGVHTIAGGEYVGGKAIHVRRGLQYKLTLGIACPIVDTKFPTGLTWTPERLGADININGALSAEADTTLVNFEIEEAAE